MKNGRCCGFFHPAISHVLDNHGFRYYDPEVGRYLTRDPIGYGDGMNVYLYVADNPIHRIDPLGMTGIPILNDLLRNAATGLDSWGGNCGSYSAAFSAGATASLLESAAYAGSGESYVNSYKSAVRNTTAVMQQQMETGANGFKAATVGISYLVGSGVGYTDALEAGFGFDWANQQEIRGTERAARAFSATGKLAGTAAGVTASYSATLSKVQAGSAANNGAIQAGGTAEATSGAQTAGTAANSTTAIVKYDPVFAVQQGAPVYRLWGEGTIESGRSWTTVNPKSFATVAEFKQASGVGDWVQPPYQIATTRFTTMEGVTSRTALPVHNAPNPWLPELRIEPPQTVQNVVDKVQSNPW